MQWQRKMTMHLQLVRLCRQKGLDYTSITSAKIKNRKVEVRVVIEEMYKQMAHKESLRKGWRSIIKDTRIK